MAIRDVATIGCTFSGYCDKRGHGSFTGTFDSNGSEILSLDGNNVCVTGTTGQASCGCRVRAIGRSALLSLEGIPVAREGDPIEGADGGGITGVITSGWPKLSID